MQRNLADQDTYTLQEAFSRLRVGRTIGYELVASGRLPVVRLTPKKMIGTRAALNALLAEGLLPSTPPTDA